MRGGGLVVLAVCLSVLAPQAWAQDPNVCDEEGESPDVIVGDLHQVNSYGNVGDIYAYSVGTVSCNIGTCWLKWFSETNEHPVIGQNMIRLHDGRMTQIGQSWLKHGFFALSDTLCSGGCLGTNGDHLGVNCSDPYSAGLNGQQSNLGPRFEINASTGEYPYPPSFDGTTGDTIYKRLQVHADDLDPALNPGALYFVEGQYVTADDAQAGNGGNNTSYRPVSVDPITYELTLLDETVREKAGIQAWAANELLVKESEILVDNDGKYILAWKITDNGDGTWHYEYALQNLTSHRSGRGFSVPLPIGATVTNMGFHDVDYHSGEPYTNQDWTMLHDTVENRVVWFGEDYQSNPNANALRWGTMYSFWFDVDVAPSLSNVDIELFRPGGAGDPDSAQIFTQTPNPCNNDGICQAPNETCSNCPADCVIEGPSVGFCGDGVCEPTIGEDCLSCDVDCNGDQTAPVIFDRFCCGDGAGIGSVNCSDPRCTATGWECGPTGIDCCGDDVCGPSEDACGCTLDCGPPPLKEAVCDDAFDQDCDGQVDCDDLDCCMDATCFTGIDADGDGVADCDCDDGNNTVWYAPSEVPDLMLEHDVSSGTTTLNWSLPADFGAVFITYETLRGGDAEDWLTVGVCLPDGDPGDLTIEELDVPAPGRVFNYLVRGVNACPEGEGTLGTDSDDNERPGGTCP